MSISFTISFHSVEIMMNSLDILKHLPGHEDREEACENVRNYLLESLRPKVAQDVHNSDSSRLKEYYYIYEKLRRYSNIR